MRRLALAICGLHAACGDNALVPASDASLTDARPADDLQATGLCLDPACVELNPDVRPYVPRFELWSDTASKRRWVYLPPGTQIDSSTMDRWVFPVGTKFWKEFTRDGTRVETRYITKLLDDDEAPGAWLYVAYEWNATQDATQAAPMGQADANGTPHDIPSRAQCRDCHDSLRPSRVLGFGAIQLDAEAKDGQLDLEQLIAEDRLTVPPPGAASPRFALPGAASDQAALGYLHANCGHCHNPSSKTISVVALDVLLDTEKLASVAVTPVYQTAVDVAATRPFFDEGVEFTKLIVGGDATSSGLIRRMILTNPAHRMPKIGAELADPDGIAALSAWANSL